MNEIKITGKQYFMGKEIPVILGGFGVDKKCISDKTIAEIHNVPVTEIRKSIGRNEARFRGNIDFIDLKIVGNEITNNLGYTQMQISKAEHMYLLSERGYAKLIKIMDTDLAWEIHDNLMDEYFTMRDKEKNMSSAEILLMYAQQFYEQEQRLLTVEQNVKELESKITTHNENYYTVAGYASLRGINVDISKASMLGRKASKLSKSYNYDVGAVQDPRFGKVNTYHVDILKEIFRSVA